MRVSLSSVENRSCPFTEEPANPSLARGGGGLTSRDGGGNRSGRGGGPSTAPHPSLARGGGGLTSRDGGENRSGRGGRPDHDLRPDLRLGPAPGGPPAATGARLLRDRRGRADGGARSPPRPVALRGRGLPGGAAPATGAPPRARWGRGG